MCLALVWVVSEVWVVKDKASQNQTLNITSEWQAKVIERAFRHKEEQLVSRP